MAQEVVTSLVGKVVDKLIGRVKEEISYMWNYSDNVKDLKEKNDKLTQMRERVQQMITAAEGEGETLLEGVKEWLENADTHISEAKEVIPTGAGADANKTCFNLGMCTNLGTLYRNGKKAANKVPSLLEVQEDGKRFESRVSVPTRAPGVLDVYDRHNIVDLDTHKLCFEKIVESIKDDNIQIIGIYGTGGVGKTTLAKEVAIEVKSLFAAIEFITVSQTVDAERIKKEVEATAKRIKKGEKILVILDDLWGELKLDEAGIPCGANYKNCKILLTSRSTDVCETMNATGLVSVDSLPPKEAWILFKRVVGDIVETDDNLKKIAEEVVEGCGGLPLIIQAVGAALKNESIESWKRAHTQLKKHTTSYIDPKISLAYSHLQLSYDFLESEESKLCFLLCSMFPEDYNIPLECLAHYGVGLEIFKDLDSMEDARNGVRHAVKILKSTCLLLDGKDDSTVKMHDVVREVALLIASKGCNKFLVKAGIGFTEWQPRTKSVKNCRGISLMCNRICELPEYEFEIPLLDIFLIQGNYDLSRIPDKFILGVKEARVLDFAWNNIVSLPPSLQQLTKLCMLNLSWNTSLRDISILGVLKSLEILILSHTGIVEIPQEIGDLVNLRRLEVKGCCGLSHIAPGVMSKLRWLEELHIAYYPVEDGNNKSLVEIAKLSMLTFLNLFVPHIHLNPKGNNENLLEIGKLSMLTFLDLFVPHINLIPKAVCFTKLKGFVIQIGGHTPIYDAAEVVHKKTLILGMKDLDTPSMLQVKELIELSDGIIFDSVLNPNIVPTMYCESLDDLTTIMLSRCENLLSLVEYSSNWDVDEEQLGGENTKKQFFSKLEHLFLLGLNKLQVLWKCPDQYIRLKNLLTLHIEDCHKLVRLFSVNAARGLVNLKSLTIKKCSSLEEVIWGGYEGDIDMVFHCLVKIELCDLTKLKSFYAGKVIIRFPSLVKVEIYRCYALERLFSVNAAQGLVNLQTLTIESCGSLKEVIWDGDEGDIDMVEFCCLVKIELRDLGELKSFYAGKAIIKFTSLVKVEIYQCEIMEKWNYNGIYVTPNLKLVNQVETKKREALNDQDALVRFRTNLQTMFRAKGAALRFLMDANPYPYREQVLQAVGLKEWPILK